MTKEEALLTLGLKIYDPDIIEEKFEELLFEKKQFFLTRTPIIKVFLAHLGKLEKLFEAKKTLLPKGEIQQDLELEVIDFSNLDDLLNYQMLWKNKLSSALQFDDISNCVRQLLQIEKEYDSIILLGILPIAKTEQWETQMVPESKKGDIMEVRNAFLKLKEYHNSKYLSLDERNIIKSEFFRIKSKQERG